VKLHPDMRAGMPVQQKLWTTGLAWTQQLEKLQMTSPAHFEELSSGGDLLSLTNSAVKDSGGGCCGSSPNRAVDGQSGSTGYGWGQCQQWSSVSNPWWGVDLGSTRTVTRVKLYNRNDCCPDRLQNVAIYLGNDWNTYSNNAQVASNVNVQGNTPLEVNIDAQGRYLFVARPGYSGLTLCEIQVWAGASTPAPTRNPTQSPTEHPTRNPTRSPTEHPTPSPSSNPTEHPTTRPPSPSPSHTPTEHPTPSPTPSPTETPTPLPTRNPTETPTPSPTPSPTPGPTTATPTVTPTSMIDNCHCTGCTNHYKRNEHIEKNAGSCGSWCQEEQECTFSLFDSHTKKCYLYNLRPMQDFTYIQSENHTTYTCYYK